MILRSKKRAKVRVHGETNTVSVRSGFAAENRAEAFTSARNVFAAEWSCAALKGADFKIASTSRPVRTRLHDMPAHGIALAKDC